MCAKARAVEAAIGVFESPDHRSVYVTRGGGHEASPSAYSASAPPESGVAIFSRASDGSLSQLPGPSGCATAWATEGCASWPPPGPGNVSVAGFDAGEWSLALTANSVYLPTFAATRSATGALGDRAAVPWSTGYWVTSALVVSPDGRNLYALGGSGCCVRDVGAEVYRLAGT